MQQGKITIDSIKAKLEAAVENIESIEIIDDSKYHSGHVAMRALEEQNQKPTLSHIRINIVSDSFKGLKPLERHRFVQGVLEEEYRAIHSISLNLRPKNE